MPLPTPAGALPSAHRQLCVRCLRATTKAGGHKCVFSSGRSKKCRYCVKQKGACVPVCVPILVRIKSNFNVLQLPWFVGDEFSVLAAAQTDEERQQRAQALNEVLLVAASEAPKTREELALAQLEELRALRAEVAVSQFRV